MAQPLGRYRERIRRITRRLGFDVVRAYPPIRSSFSVVKGSRAMSVPPSRLWISFSLYGSDPLYLQGIVAACASYSDQFPGWRPIVSVGDSVSFQLRHELEQCFGALIVPKRGFPEDSSAMLWRYLAADAVSADVVIFRDADSRASRRERAAVDEWLASGATFHLMRDHPNHTHPIMGGMWGVRVPVSPSMAALIACYGPDDRFSGDQRWLASVMYPRARRSCLVHQDAPYFNDAPEVVVRPFPVPGEQGAYVGQGLMSDGTARPGHERPT